MNSPPPSEDIRDYQDGRCTDDDPYPIEGCQRRHLEEPTCKVDDEDLSDQNDGDNQQETGTVVLLPGAGFENEVVHVENEASSAAEILGVEDVPKLHHDKY